ncbi:serine-rich adhesin for platelets [Hoplias malabaricus]|uniref:serine-rich adhesin for platelets n=1 Tax=Hoplias malabaricus TaxID=27720 RepID=UPI003461A402
MASACKRQLCTNEKRGYRQDLQLWRSKLVHCVGTEKILELLLGTRILEDLRLFKDYKPASGSNWSFDETCLFCCLRREKVKEHVVALNNKIVESGGKPLLGKDQSYISRLEWQVEEFLNAVLHRKEYTPRIPDPHIPVVACDTMQQMIGQLVVHYTSNTNSQGSPQHNGKMDQSLLNTCSITPSTIAAPATVAACAQNPVLSKLLMADQDAPLDLSVKKVKAEICEQDGVLDLSLKKSRTPDSISVKSHPVNFMNAIVSRDNKDPGLARDLQSAFTLEQFMSKLCLHHQRQVVDAFGFLQTEVKASSNIFQTSSPTTPEKPHTSGSSHPTFDECFRNQRSDDTQSLPLAISTPGVQELPFLKNNDISHAEQPLKTEGLLIAPVKTQPSLSVCKADIADEILPSSNVVGAECKNTNVQPKCPTLLIVKNRASGSLEAKNLTEEASASEPVNTGTIEQNLCTSDTPLQASSCESDVVELSSSVDNGHTEPCAVEKSLSTHSKGSSSASCTSNVISPISPRTARKSRRGSNPLQRESSGCHMINDPDDVNYDTVYVGKPITECQLQSQNHMFPRKNARKSTRGYRYIGDCCELKTVRTLASKSADGNGNGNYPVPMPEMITSVTPKQAHAKPDGVPPVDVPITGDCIEPVTNKKPSDQPEETDVPEDDLASEDLVVETSQTGQNQSLEQISCVAETEQNDLPVQQILNAGMQDRVSNDVLDTDEDLNDSNVADHTPPQAIEPTTNENTDTPISDEVNQEQGQNVVTEALQSPLPLDITKDGVSELDGTSIENDLEAQNVTEDNSQTESLEQTKCMEVQVMTCTDNNAQLEMSCGSETNLKPGYGINTKDKETESVSSGISVEEMAAKEQPEECTEEKFVENNPDNFSTKKIVTKTTVSSDRCLRSRVSKGTAEQILVSSTPSQIETQSDSPEKHNNIPEPKRPLKTSKLKQLDENVSCSDSLSNLNTSGDSNLEKTHKGGNMMCTRQKQKLMIEKESDYNKEQDVPELSIQKDEGKVQEQNNISNDIPENVVVIPPKNDESPGKSVKSSERMQLRNRQIEQNSTKVPSPVKNVTQSPEQMLQRNRNSGAVDQPVSGDPPSSPSRSCLEKPSRMPLRSRDSCNAEQTVSKDSCTSPSRNSSESVTRMPLRSRNSSTVDQHACGDSASAIKNVSNTSNSQSEQPSSDLSPTNRKAESTGHMPLRSGTISVEQPSKSTLIVGNTTESPGRMSLRRGADKMDNPTTPPKSLKPSQKSQRMSKTPLPSSVQEGEQSPVSGKGKNDKLHKDEIKGSSLPDNLLVPLNLPTTSPIVPCPSKFLEALNGEENQHLILDLNTKFDKMQKGWVQMDKEGQPAPKPKNKADRLKEIWKSKKRIRKPKSLEQQKFSPVQMLFMKSFDLPSICRWFLQSTETKSLVIVKKVNTRLPSETQLCFHSSASVPGSSNGVFPSVQAERLKKHLKKFAIASPVRSNPKNKRLIAKALAEGISISKGKEKREPSTATRISTKPHSYTGLIQPQPAESHSKVQANAKNPASARILRKYSNMREKMQVQQNTLKNLDGSMDKTKKMHVMPKNIAKDISASKGQRSAIVKKVKALANKAKAKSVNKDRTPNSSVRRALRGFKDRDNITTKKDPSKLSKESTGSEPKTTSRKETPAKSDKTPQTKTDIKKSLSPKAPESLPSPSQSADMKLQRSEDQVLTRSQRKIEATLAQTGSPKATTKRSTELVSTPAKRARTSK